MNAARVPLHVQQRLDEPTDGELLPLLRAIRDGDGRGWWPAQDALTDVYRSIAEDRAMSDRVMARVRELRDVVRAERGTR